ncbi:hypothetical protein E4K32_001431, partial [Enterococcus faecalis]|nr:hypothetical protein [Enterococcus faecalis]HAP3847350.1 hypothetical protein [Enterococcus faecalis]
RFFFILKPPFEFKYLSQPFIYLYDSKENTLKNNSFFQLTTLILTSSLYIVSFTLRYLKETRENSKDYPLF